MAEDGVEVHFFAAARAAVGLTSVRVPPGTLADICTTLEGQYPSFAQVRPQCSFLVDERAVHGDPSATQIPAGSRLDVLPPFAGGAK